jgi:hypothetical protein
VLSFGLENAPGRLLMAQLFRFTPEKNYFNVVPKRNYFTNPIIPDKFNSGKANKTMMLLAASICHLSLAPALAFIIAFCFAD